MTKKDKEFIADLDEGIQDLLKTAMFRSKHRVNEDPEWITYILKLIAHLEKRIQKVLINNNK